MGITKTEIFTEKQNATASLMKALATLPELLLWSIYFR